MTYKKLTLAEKKEKYIQEHPFYEEYRGWKIRTYKLIDRYFGPQLFYTVDVRVGIESCMASTIEQAKQFIDQKIKEGKHQQEDF